jgi:hypothetical protein
MCPFETEIGSCQYDGMFPKVWISVDGCSNLSQESPRRIDLAREDLRLARPRCQDERLIRVGATGSAVILMAAAMTVIRCREWSHLPGAVVLMAAAVGTLAIQGWSDTQSGQTARSVERVTVLNR